MGGAGVEKLRWWPKKTTPDWNLLTIGEIREHFPDAEMAVERCLGLPKSVIAIKR